MAAEVCAYRRWPFSDLQAITDIPQGARLIRAVGRSGENSWIHRLHKALDFLDQHIALEVGIALLRLGQNQHLGEFLQRSTELDDLHLVVGLGGDGKTTQALGQRIDSQPSPQAVLALGLLGNPASILPLINSLSEESSAENAALALWLLTGAEVMEEKFIEEPVDPDTLFENEDPSEQDQPQGEIVVRLSQKPKDWQDWWSAHSQDFRQRKRYRLGKPYSPTSLIETLESPTATSLIRRIAADELAIRYGIVYPIDVGLFVNDQMKSIDQLKRLVATQGRSFQTGKWTFMGRNQ